MMKYKYYLVIIFYVILFLISFYTISFIFNIIDDIRFYFIYFIFASLLALISWGILSYFLKGLNRKKYLDVIISVILLIYMGAGYGILMLINSLGEVKKIMVESKIYEIQNQSSSASGLFKLKMDNEFVFIEVINPCYRVGDTYKMIIHEGCLGIKYFVPHGGFGYYEKNLNCEENKEKSKYEKTVISKKDMYKNKIYRKEGILDNAINNKNYKFIHYLRKHGAKRSCEILKTKCKPLSPKIEKILKNDKK